jgi:hypothetical protein
MMAFFSPAVRNRVRFYRWTGRIYLTALAVVAVLGAGCTVVCAQESPPVPQGLPAANVPLPEETSKNATAPCFEPPPMVRLQDYNGPLKKTVGIFARKLERKAVKPPHYKPGAILCSLELKDKFVLFVMDSIDPVSFLEAGYNAGLAQGQDDDHSFGQGVPGYAKRFGASFTDQASSKFFTEFAYPAIFSEDPRYYRLGNGGAGKRFLHAVTHAVIAHRDNGKRMFNFSEWLGTTSAVVLSNTYHPDNERGFAPAAQAVASSVIQDVGFDVLREFWPEISRKFRLPFRDESDPATREANPADRKMN